MAKNPRFFSVCNILGPCAARDSVTHEASRPVYFDIKYESYRVQKYTLAQIFQKSTKAYLQINILCDNRQQVLIRQHFCTLYIQSGYEIFLVYPHEIFDFDCFFHIGCIFHYSSSKAHHIYTLTHRSITEGCGCPWDDTIQRLISQFLFF